MNLTPDLLSKYLEQKLKHKFYAESVGYAEELLIHFDGKKPGKLLTERRPSESKEIHEFRDKIFKSKTKAYCDKITNALMKIRKSSDWMVKYPEVKPDEVNYKVSQEESLQAYMEKSFPRYDSFTNWYFQVGFKNELTDSNAFCLWRPLNEELKDNEYYKPYPFVYKSENVIDYEYGEWYLFLSEEKNTFRENNSDHQGWIYIYVDKESIYTIKQINLKGGYSIDEFAHGLSRCPVVPFGGVIQKETLHYTLKQSRVYGIVPSFDEAVREYSDLQAEVLQHIHSTFWSHAGQDCKKCKATGFIPKKDAAPVECKACHGKGSIPVSPYQHFEIPKPKSGEPMFTGIPMGYIQKQIDIAVLQDKRIRDHIKDGLSAVNMEFLIDPPQLAQSGISKEVDKDDMHTFFHAVAEDIVRFMDAGYSIVGDYRNGGLMSMEERLKTLPTIPVPEKYDLMSETYLVSEIKMLKEAGVSPSVITLAQKDYTKKRYFADTKAQSFCENVLELDPFASRSEDDILMQLQNDGVSMRDYVIHCNIEPFIMQAVADNELFFILPFNDRRAVLKKYADAAMKQNSSEAKVIPINQPLNKTA